MRGSSDTQPTRRGAIERTLVASFAACLLLLAQFLLGMVVNLYVNIPHHHPGTGAHNFFAGIASAGSWVIPDGPVWLAAHVVFGLALVVAAFANVAWSWRIGNRLCTAVSALGALAILGAAFNGFSFVNYGHDFSSMIMAGLWALALASYLTCLFATARRYLILSGPYSGHGESREPGPAIALPWCRRHPTTQHERRASC